MVKKGNGGKRRSTALDRDGRRSQWLKGVLELCLLGVLDRGEAYGYEISQQLEASGLGEVKGGTLYPRLASLEAAGLVQVDWRAGDGGPGRKYYRLTAVGRSTLLESAADYDRFSEVTRALIRSDEPIDSPTTTETEHVQNGRRKP